MHRLANHWHKAIWKILTNSTVEVVAAIVVVVLSAWFVVQTEVDLRHHRQPAVPLLFGAK